MYEDYQQPEDDGALQFWVWCEEQSALHADDDDDECNDPIGFDDPPPF